MIYLIAAREVELCKIGFAENVEKRIAVLATACPHDLDLIAAREGDVLLERAIHRAAVNYHVRREWFRFCPEVVETFHGTKTPVGMKTHSDIVRCAGKPEEVASALGVSVHTVRSWIQRDSIPADKWAAFARAGHASLETLAEAAATRSAAA